MRRMASQPPELDGLHFIRLLGSGGFSDVFLYEQELPKRSVAVKVLLTDGVNDDGDESDDARQLQDLLSTLQRGTNGETAKPIRVFTIAYGKDADLDTLKRIAQASNAAAYDASNPATISKVFTAVLSNF